MKIAFGKVKKTPSRFSLALNTVEFSGDFFRCQNNYVCINGHLSGSVQATCDRCASKFSLSVDENLELQVTDGGCEDSRALDVIECQDHTIDFEQIAQSEVEALLSDYHLCENCSAEENFEIEL